MINGGIRVVVLAINGGKVRLGFEAPASVVVLRGEVHRREAAGAEAGGPAQAAAVAGGSN